MILTNYRRATLPHNRYHIIFKIYDVLFSELTGQEGESIGYSLDRDYYIVATMFTHSDSKIEFIRKNDTDKS